MVESPECVGAGERQAIGEWANKADKVTGSRARMMRAYAVVRSNISLKSHVPNVMSYQGMLNCMYSKSTDDVGRQHVVRHGVRPCTRLGITHTRSC